MSRRTKLLITALFLVLLAIPAWHVASNWAPANPLRFRLLSRQTLPDEGVFRSESLEIEVRNTSTASRHVENMTLNPAGVPWDPFAPSMTVKAAKMMIPAGGTVRGTVTLVWPKEETAGPGPVEVTYFHASTMRHRVMSWYSSLVDSLPVHQQERFWLPIWSECTSPLETSP